MKDKLSDIDIEPNDSFYICEDCDEKHRIYHVFSIVKIGLSYAYYVCRGNELLYKINGRSFID